MIEPDPSHVDEPRDRVNRALGVLATHRHVTFRDAMQLLLQWANECAMSTTDVADLVLAEARLRAEDHEA